jgi:hypothetical protein
VADVGPRGAEVVASLPARAQGGRAARFLLARPVSEPHAVSVLLLGFSAEGATELVQFAERARLAQGPLEYYVTLVTTILGFYLMFLGLKEWRSFHPRATGRPSISARRRTTRFRVELWAGGTIAGAAVALGLDGGGAWNVMDWVAWPIAGLVVLAFGDFFFGLRARAHRARPTSWNALGWLAFGWSMGVGVWAGLAVGERTVLLLSEFVTNWVALIASAAPIVVAMSPLFVAYGLIAGAFLPRLRTPVDLDPRPPADPNSTHAISRAEHSSPT